MDLVYTSQTPELLVSGELKSKKRVPVKHAPSIPVTVHHELALVADFFHCRQSNTIKTDHRCGTSCTDDFFIVPQHSVQFVTEIKCIHHFLTCSVSMFINYLHHRIHPFIK